MLRKTFFMINEPLCGQFRSQFEIPTCKIPVEKSS